ncbi:hypothetical protein [Acetohalobium arabaticum]|uniref:Uncharacterized protein n=1 Tax=Acetohalobium arabaticum (strain ATCC 49924 / DSM 5501 / Z-7288) TaxID=574087 RepID=D9QV71_ACEAZ|nr:hypothetical protein [Acetohalobium arabaticum]ADL12130.1 hypothetical protein Acear_0587 [Acetohalobium arabaticum DSM 5501]
MNLSTIQILLHIVPESFLLIYVSLGLINIKIKLQQHIKITIIYTCCLILLRDILNLYGLHIIFLFLSLTLLFRIFIEISWNLAIIASLLGFIILLLSELVLFPLVFQYLNTNIKTFINNDLILFSIIFYLTKLPSLIMSLMIYFFDFHLLNSEYLNDIFDFHLLNSEYLNDIFNFTNAN